MAQSYTDPIGGELVIPGAYPSITVAPAAAGLATTGILVLLGEADSGPSYSEETELADNIFGPDDIQSIIDKYKSGPIVDAARAAAGAAVDPEITAAFSGIIIAKTNTGVKASSGDLLTGVSSVVYDSLQAKLSGTMGNLIGYQITDEVAAVLPTTGSFTYIPQPGVLTFNVHLNGAAASAITTVADDDPATTVARFSMLTTAGGALRVGAVPAPGVNTLVVGLVSAPNRICTFTLSVPWVGVAVGDTLEIPAGSQFAGAGSANVGWWVVTAVDGAIVTATKLSDKTTTPGHVAGNVVNPVGVLSTAVANPAATDIQFYTPITLTWAPGVPRDGLANTLEIAATSTLSGDTDPRNALRQLGTSAKCTWVSTSVVPNAIVGTQRQVNISTFRKLDNITEEFIAGGEVGLRVGYSAGTCTIDINSTGLTVVYNPGSPVTLTMSFAQYPTIADVASYLDSIAGFTAEPGTAVIGNLPSSALDATDWGVQSIGYVARTTHGAYACQIKIDAYRLRAALAASYLVEFAGTPLGGLPAVTAAVAYLSGGTRGATTAANVSGAIDAIEQVRANFVVPLFSRDASEDILDGLTDAGSTYQIDAVNSLVKTHVHKMSGMKTKRNRQAFVSKRGAFADVEEAAANLASHRCMMAFQDVKNSNSGSIVQYQPYIGAVLAAAMQAGAFYKSIVRKQVNTTGVVQAAGDWTYNRDSLVERALKAGLNPIKKAEEGGFVWVSDQTTYGKDSKNFYNSVQMVYAGDIVALTTAQRMDRAFTGQSVADVSAPVALSYLDSIMADFLRLKLIAPSSDAPLGYKNARVVITGGVMRVSVEVKIAGSIYFTAIAFYVTEITQSA